MSNLFLSTLGTGKYIPCRYVLDERTSELVPFVQEALVEHICPNWNDNDKIVIMCTTEAEEKNWKDNAHFELGLETRLRNKKFKPRIKMINIPTGQNEQEIMQIFLKTIEAIGEGDCVYLDITHSFRSIPLLMIVILNYAKVVKKISVGGIYYGAFEVLGTPKEVEQMSEDKRVAPIFNLTPYDSLLDWTKAVEVFDKAGYAGDLTRLLNRDIGQLFRQEKNSPEGLRRFSQLRARLEALWQNLLTARGPEIDTKEPLIPLIESLRDLTLIPPMTPLFEILKKELIALDEPDPIKRALNAAEWCIRHFMIPQAYALMREAIITGLCRAGGYDPFDEKIREEFIGGILYILAQKLPREQWKAELKFSAQEVEHFMNKGGSALEELAKAFDPLRRYRNDLLHAGWKRERTSAKSLVVNANTHHQELVSAFENLGHFRKDSSRRALVVISHELTSNQAEELRSIWLVKEILFLPEELARMWENFPPEAESVEEAVEPILKWLLQKSYLGDLVVVQGEHGATLKVALFAYSIGLVPIYATTKRVLQETRLPDGSVRQERIFKHVRFRKYFC